MPLESDDLKTNTIGYLIKCGCCSQTVGFLSKFVTSSNSTVSGSRVK